MVAVKGDHVVEFPVESVPCSGCGSTERPLVFRGWVRLVGFVWAAREARSSAYVCEPCAQKQTATTLCLNALVGWWSIPSWLFYGWRAVFHNWRAVWTAPVNPGAWGAIDAKQFAHSSEKNGKPRSRRLLTSC
jgi:hypothetical protein